MEIRFQGITLGSRGPDHHGVVITGFDPSYPELRTSDTNRSARDGVMPGRDRFGVRTLALDLSLNRTSMPSAREAAAELLTAWRDSSIRLSAGELVPLEFRPADSGDWRRVLGRPRRIDDPDFGVVMRQGAGALTAEFDVMNPLVFSGGGPGLHEVELRQAESYVAGGWTWPRDPGWPVTGQTVEGSREGALSIGGTEPTPVVVTFHGPGSRFVLTGSRGWRVALRSGVELAHDESITIDPLAGTVTDNFGRARFGDLQTPLFSVELDPGGENVFFSAVDQSMSATATVEWRDAFSSMA